MRVVYRVGCILGQENRMYKGGEGCTGRMYRRECIHGGEGMGVLGMM